MVKIVRLIIEGQVQGVGYRQWFFQAACELQLIGWVRNRRDGTVEAVISGDELPVAALIDRAKKGPKIGPGVADQRSGRRSGELAGFFDPANRVSMIRPLRP